MSQEFTAAVDSVVCQVLDLLDRMNAGEEFDPLRVQVELLDRIEQGDASVGALQSWELARYALVSWIDEVLLDTDWSGRDWWNNNVLEAELFRTRDCSEQFFVRAEQARGLSSTEALEVFYDCVILGFRGMYRSQEIAQVMSRNEGLSDSLEAWLRRTSLTIEKKRPVITKKESLPVGAPPRTARRCLIGTGFLLLFIVIVDVLLYQLRGIT